MSKVHKKTAMRCLCDAMHEFSKFRGRYSTLGFIYINPNILEKYFLSNDLNCFKNFKKSHSKSLKKIILILYHFEKIIVNLSQCKDSHQ